MMKRFFGVIRYEYRMSTQRLSLWIVMGLISAFYLYSGVVVEPQQSGMALTAADLWRETGFITYRSNLFLPVAAGILISDRMWRDRRYGMKELLDSAGLTGWTYILGKYFASLLSLLTPTFVLSLIMGGVALMAGAPLVFLPILLVGFLAINVPAFAFITIFSLACPLFMPLRVYQVLFTGYWFWGNFLNPEVFPTLNGTLLTPGGSFAMEGFFGATFGNQPPVITPAQAVLNLVVLAGCILLAMFALERYLVLQAGRS